MIEGLKSAFLLLLHYVENHFLRLVKKIVGLVQLTLTDDIVIGKITGLLRGASAAAWFLIAGLAGLAVP